MVLKIYFIDCANISLDILLNSSYLSDKDIDSFAKYKHELTKKEKIVSTILKNKYIGDYYIDENGKPLSKDKYFNISHSHGLVTLVIDDVPIGIDIERIRSVDKDLIDYISNNEEKEYIHDEVSFYEIWTSKEALVKAEGKGIKQKPRLIPGLPLNNIRKYGDNNYYSKTLKYLDSVITVTRKKDEDFSLDIIMEVI